MEVINVTDWLEKNKSDLSVHLNPYLDTKQIIKGLEKFIRMCIPQEKKVGDIAVTLWLANNKLCVTDSYKIMGIDMEYLPGRDAIYNGWNSKEILEALRGGDEIGITCKGDFIVRQGEEVRVVKPINKQPPSIEIMLNMYFNRSDKDGASIHIKSFSVTPKWKAVYAVKDIEECHSYLNKNGKSLQMVTEVEDCNIHIDLGVLDLDKEYTWKPGFNRLWLKDILEVFKENIDLTVGNTSEPMTLTNGIWWCLIMTRTD